MRRPIAYMRIAGALRDLDADPEVVADILERLPSDDGLTRRALADPAGTVESFGIPGLWREAVFMDKGEPGVCPTCGDPLQGTKCKRCDWGVPSPNVMTDADSNPSDVTKELKPAIQS